MTHTFYPILGLTGVKPEAQPYSEIIYCSILVNKFIHSNFRETPTSAGPNSFGKTKQGFCDAKKVFEKNLKQALETADKPTPKIKFPQTIYKIVP